MSLLEEMFVYLDAGMMPTAFSSVLAGLNYSSPAQNIGQASCTMYSSPTCGKSTHYPVFPIPHAAVRTDLPQSHSHAPRILRELDLFSIGGPSWQVGVLPSCGRSHGCRCRLPMLCRDSGPWHNNRVAGYQLVAWALRSPTVCVAPPGMGIRSVAVRKPAPG